MRDVRRHEGRARARSAASRPARTARCARRIDSLLKRGAQGVRARPARQRRRAAQRGGGDGEHLHPRGDDRRPRRAASARARVFEATGDPIDTKIPVVVLVNRESASASEIVTGALQDRKRAEVVGTRTFGKGVFQEIRELSNGGALDITVGEYFTPSGRNLGGGGVKPGAGIKPDVKARGRHQTRSATRRSRSRSRRSGARRREPAAAARRQAAPGARRADARPAAALRRRDRPRDGEPPPQAAGGPVVARARAARALPRGRAVLRSAGAGSASTARAPASRPRPGDLVLVAPTGPRAGHGKLLRRLGRPDIARDVLEALMLDRGLRRRFDPVVEREARAAAERARPTTRRRAATCATCRRSRSTRRPRATSTTRSAPSAATAARSAIWVHIADVAAHVPPGSARRPRGPPPRDQRLRARRGRADAARGALQRRLLARARARTASRSPSSSTSTARRVVRSAFYRSLIRSDARLDYPRVDRIFAGARARGGAVGASRWRPRARVAAALDAARRARAGRSRSSPSSRSSTSRARAT